MFRHRMHHRTVNQSSTPSESPRDSAMTIGVNNGAPHGSSPSTPLQARASGGGGVRAMRAAACRARSQSPATGTSLATGSPRRMIVIPAVVDRNPFRLRCPPLRSPPSVMPGLVPGIHAAVPGEAVEGDARNKSGHDGRGAGITVWGPGRGRRSGPRSRRTPRNPVESGPCALPAKAEPDSNGTSPGMTRRRHESEVEAAGIRLSPCATRSSSFGRCVLAS